MGVGGDMYRGLGVLACVGFVVCALAAISGVGFVLWLLWRGIVSVLS